MITGYSFRFAFESLRKEFWINLIATLSAGLGLFLIAVIAMVFYNLNVLTKRLPEKFTVVLYLKVNTPKEEIDRTITELKNDRVVKSVRFISRDEAFNELKRRLKDPSILFEGIDENPLPDSLEIKIKPEYMKKAELKDFLSKLGSRPVVDDIDYGEDIMSSIILLKKVIETSGLAIVGMILTGVLFNFYTTIKILFYRRREEVETFKLLGASGGFIRAPFLIEGAIIGAAGGAIACGFLLALYKVITLLSAQIAFMSSLDLQPQLLALFGLLPLSGGTLGILGAFIGLGRIRY